MKIDSRIPKKLPAWETFLKTHQACGAHFHGEGDPPDLILEVRPSPDSQSWLVVARPLGHPDTDDTRNQMCEEMLGLIPECASREFWYVEGNSLCKETFVFTHPYTVSRREKDTREPKAWFRTGWTEDDYGYTLGKDVWNTPDEPTRLAKQATCAEIEKKEKEILSLKRHLANLGRRHEH